MGKTAAAHSDPSPAMGYFRDNISSSSNEVKAWSPGDPGRRQHSLGHYFTPTFFGLLFHNTKPTWQAHRLDHHSQKHSDAPGYQLEAVNPTSGAAVTTIYHNYQHVQQQHQQQDKA